MVFKYSLRFNISFIGESKKSWVFETKILKLKYKKDWLQKHEQIRQKYTRQFVGNMHGYWHAYFLAIYPQIKNLAQIVGRLIQSVWLSIKIKRLVKINKILGRYLHKGVDLEKKTIKNLTH